MTDTAKQVIDDEENSIDQRRVRMRLLVGPVVLVHGRP